jgi:hypothetical protein
MSGSQLHHYVPQFYLRRFLNPSGHLWAWDRDEDRAFQTTPKSVAAERSFYYLDLYADQDPLAMEKQFAQIEYDVARLTTQWLDWIRSGRPGEALPIPEPNRKLFSQFVGLQFMRTADFRDILAAFATQDGDSAVDAVERRALHTHALWDEDFVSEFTEYVESAIWLFGRNSTDVPFITSDNPVAFRLPDHSMWLKVGLFGSKTYAVYPLAPDIVLYCHPRVEPWRRIEHLDCCISPINFSEEMVESENSGQVFMASRFVISRNNDFEQARAFAKTIGTDQFASHWKDPVDG